MSEALAPNPQQVFLDGVAKVSEKKTEKALQSFQSIRATGLTSADLESNLGRLLVEQGQVGQGLIHLTTALKLNRFSSDARADLEFARSKVKSGWGQPMSHPAEWGACFATYLRPRECGIGFLFVLLAYFTFKVFQPALFSKFKQSFAVALAVCALGGGLGLWGSSFAVLIEESDLKVAPLESSEALLHLESGVRVRKVRASGDFIEVERAGSFRGWVLKSKVVF